MKMAPELLFVDTDVFTGLSTYIYTENAKLVAYLIYQFARM